MEFFYNSTLDIDIVFTELFISNKIPRWRIWEKKLYKENKFQHETCQYISLVCMVFTFVIFSCIFFKIYRSMKNIEEYLSVWRIFIQST